MDTATTFAGNLGEVFHSLSDFFAVKILSSWAMIIAFYLVGADHIPLVGALTVLVAIDFATGVYAAYKTGEQIESRRMIKTAIKWTLYMLMLSAAHLTEELVQFHAYLADVTLAFLGATELISILENVGKTGVAIPQRLLNKLEKYRDEQ